LPTSFFRDDQSSGGSRVSGIRCWIVAAAVALAAPHVAGACTGITLKADDGSTVFARTMELGGGLVPWGLVVVPRGTSYAGSTPSGRPGLEWTAKYAFTGANASGLPYVADGVNEAGLATGAFMFAHYAEYQKVTESDAEKTLASFELPTWILSNFATVAEVKEGLSKIKVADVTFDAPGWGGGAPFHWFVIDETGAAVVVEYVGGELNIHDNPIGVITNAPTFDWHLTNLKSYVNLSPQDVPELELGSLSLSEFGHGTGLHGLPGDFTPPSRFVRAAFLKTAAVPGKTAAEAVTRAFHVLNQFDIPLGTVRGAGPAGQPMLEQTDWTSASDLANRRYYIHTVETRRVHVIDLKKAPLDAAEPFNVALPTEETFVDLTPAAGGE
jgi:choloylglycine hydrolase